MNGRIFPFPLKPQPDTILSSDVLRFGRRPAEKKLYWPRRVGATSREKRVVRTVTGRLLAHSTTPRVGRLPKSREIRPDLIIACSSTHPAAAAAATAAAVVAAAAADWSTDLARSDRTSSNRRRGNFAHGRRTYVERHHLRARATTCLVTEGSGTRRTCNSDVNRQRVRGELSTRETTRAASRLMQSVGDINW
jgi:hypothetical protein